MWYPTDYNFLRLRLQLYLVGGGLDRLFYWKDTYEIELLSNYVM